MRGRGPVNPVRDAEIAGLIADGRLTLHVIGLRYGITREAVRQAGLRMGVSRCGVITPAVPKRHRPDGHLIAGNACGECGASMPDGFQVHRNFAGHTIHPHSRLHLSDLDTIARLYLEGHGYRHIGRRFAITPMAVRRHVLAAGIDPHPTGRHPQKAGTL